VFPAAPTARHGWHPMNALTSCPRGAPLAWLALYSLRPWLVYGSFV